MVQAGSGGNGCSSFFKDRRIRYPKADGGNGGNGGDVIFQADESLQTLLDFQYRQHFLADKGSHGSGNEKQGAEGGSLVVLVPVGTVVRDVATGLLVRDLTEHGQRVIVCRGGRGGRGNTRWHQATPGQPGEEKHVLLELKLIADVGIVGLPNAGKSSLINRISNAKSRTADFPFTTLSPVLGVVDLGGSGRRFVAVDIPGIIEGAHEGRGLGHEFLRHVERTKLLVHLVDVAGVEGRDPVQDYQVLNRELQRYHAPLSRKPQIIAANKLDLTGARESVARFKSRVGESVWPISCATGEGIPELLLAIEAHLLQARTQAASA